jgi:acetyl esterase
LQELKKYPLTRLPSEIAGVDSCFHELLGNPRNNLRAPRPDGSMSAFRAALDLAMIDPEPPEVFAVDELLAELESGPVPLRLYRPNARSRLPVIMFIHGGGFVIGSLETHDALCRALANASGAAVLAVEYRKAPETPFPGALDDCCNALRWIFSHAEQLSIDAARIALCGDSAGGNLAAMVALWARANSFALRHLALIYPVIDPEMQSESSQAFGSGFILTREFIEWFWSAYLGRPYDSHDPRMNIMAAELSGLPPTSVIIAEFDPLRDEGEGFARAVAAAGTRTIVRRYPGMIHGFLCMAHITPTAGRAIVEVGEDLKNSLWQLNR